MSENHKRKQISSAKGTGLIVEPAEDTPRKSLLPDSLQLTKSDEWIIRNYGVLSPEELEAQTGVPADVVYKRANEILSSVDILTVAQKRAKLMLQLESLANELEQRMKNAPLEFVSGIANSVKNMISAVLKQMNENERLTNGQIELAESRYAMIWAQLSGQAIERVYQDLVDRGVDVEYEEVATGFMVHLQELAARYDKGDDN